MASVGALAGIPQRHRSADPSAAASDQRNSPIQYTHLVSASLQLWIER